jgi:hypothetical protein
MLKFGEEASFKVGAVVYTLSPFDVDAINAFRDWVAARVDVPGKLETAERFADKLPEEGTRILREAMETQKQLDGFSMACPLAQDFMKTEAGMVEFYSILLRKKHPRITSAEVLTLIIHAGKELKTASEKAQGKVGGAAKNGGAPGREAPASSTGPASTAASTSAAPA